MTCQPKWRIKTSDGKGFRPSGGIGDWTCLQIGGNNGILLHVMALAWWGNATLNNPQEAKKWISAVKEVSWALKHMRISHKK